MIQTVEAIVDATGQVRLLGHVRVDGPRRRVRAGVDEPAAGQRRPHSGGAGLADWSRPEEDAAWSRLQSAK